MNIYIKEIEDLEIIRRSGLMKICSKNHYFSGYDRMDVPEIKKKIASFLKNGYKYYIPELQINDFKEKYQDFISIYL